MQGEEERQIGVVRVEQIEVAEVESVISWNSGEKGVEQVVAFFIERRIMHAEDFVELRSCPFDRGEIAVVEHDGEREETEVVAVKLNLFDPFSELADLRFLGIVEQGVLRGGIVQIDLAKE